ncbi:hypothetical protein [Calothrix sp. UHCC 0171]|nr:hypothetical protein [Calothrix sp. UHCC 0171]MEA5572852.1 hypothetical protein [Calothrix sp. UHCC 0171]
MTEIGNAIALQNNTKAPPVIATKEVIAESLTTNESLRYAIAIYSKTTKP